MYFVTVHLWSVLILTTAPVSYYLTMVSASLNSTDLLVLTITSESSESAYATFKKDQNTYDNDLHYDHTNHSNNNVNNM